MATILIVDDRYDNCRFLSKLLGYYHHRSIEASDGLEALEKLKSDVPDLIITDVLMPKMDGYELVRKLREDPATAHIPIIVYTALYLAQAAQSLAKTHGVCCILTKPSKPRLIIKAVEDALKLPRASFPDTPEIVHEQRRQFDKAGSPSPVTDSLELVNRRLEALIELGQRLASEHDPRRLIETLCDEARKIIGARYAFIKISSEESPGRRFFIASGIEIEIARLSLAPATQELLDQVFTARHALRRRCAALEARAFNSPDSMIAYNALLGAPIVTLTGFYGWLCLADKLGAEEFNEEEERLSAMLAAQIAIAYENLERYTRLKNEMERSTDLQARFAGILASARDAIITIDEEQRIILFNSAAESMFECPASDAIDQSLDRFIPARYRESHRRHIHKFGETQVTRRTMGELMQLSGLRADGKEFPIEASISQVNAEGQKLFTVIIRDITEKKKLEAQFLRAQRMESIGTLAGGIAHDLNNVLSPIMTSVELLQRRISDESGQRLLHILHTAVVRGAEMIKQILSFARGVEGDYIELQPIHLIKEILKILADTLPKNIAITYSGSSDLWCVKGDATQLHQVLINLCVNARDAMADGGELRIEAENVEVDEQYARLNVDGRPGRFVAITVVDNGTGISQQDLSKIFDPFFTTKEQGRGTGLGLSTVASIIRSHGGFLSVYSEVPRGSQFKIYLPAVESIPADGTQLDPCDLPLGNGELILVVDDEISVRELAREALETFGYKVLTAGDGTEALTLFAARLETVGCVITDMMMPIMDGPAVIRALRKLKPDIKIIATSGLKANGRTVEAANMGVTTFLQKPYTTETLLKTLAGELNS